MANYNTLKTSIAAVIKQNGNNEITGPILQQTLLGMVNSLGANYQFAGIATPSTNPGTPDQNVFYLASTAGTYANFGGLVLADGEIAILKWNGAWSKDSTGAASSEKLNQLGQQVIYDVTKNNPTAGPNNDGKFKSLSALLSDENLSTLIPSAVRCGGMSIRFVQSSDNKYVQYRLMSDGWSINTNDWFIAEEGVYVENPEFVYVKTDAEGKILWAIKTDGTIYFGAGVPPQVVDYIQQKIEEFSLEDIVTFLNGLETDDKTLAELLNEKVNKVQGKGLSTNDYTDEDKSVVDIQQLEENPEFMSVVVDSEDKVIEGIDISGRKVIDTTLAINDTIIDHIENPEFLYVFTDKYNRLLWGIQTDGNVVYGYGVPKQIREYIQSQIDKILGVGEDDTTTSIDHINEVYNFLNGFSTSDTLKNLIPGFVENPEYYDVVTDSEERIVEGITTDWTKKINIPIDLIGCSLDAVNNPEYIEVKTDKDNKVLSYRDYDGKLHEEAGVVTPEATADVINTRQINIVGIPDAVEDTFVYRERPKFAEFWFYGELPTDLSDDRIPTYLDFIYKVSGQTNLVAKCSLAIQGHGSASFDKKGYTFNTLNKNGDELKVKFGDMIATDSFHLKAYATDVTHSHDVGSANLWRAMMRQLDYPECKINNKIYDATDLSTNEIYIADAKYACDGFPVAVYLNDSFFGLYTLRLKKTRENYALDKSDYNQIYLDSITYTAWLRQPFDYTDWEMKNPKISGYHEGEAIPDVGINICINNLFTYLNAIYTAYNTRTPYTGNEDYVTLDHWLVYCIFVELIYHCDTTGNNMNIITWDNQHWSIVPYDMDLSVGILPHQGVGKDEFWALTSLTGFQIGDVFAALRTVYLDRVKVLYTKMRNSGLISVESVISFYKDIMTNIPRTIYEKDRKKWPNIYSSGYPTLEQMRLFVSSRINFLDTEWLVNN